MAAENGPTLSASGNHFTTVYQAAGNINLHQRPLLPTLPAGDVEITSVRRAWVKVTASGTPVHTAERVLSLLRDGEPIVVISGPRGSGKTAAALRALSDPTLQLTPVSDPAPQNLRVEHILADWDTPNSTLLPCQPGRGYLLDTVGETWTDPPEAAQQLLQHATALRRAGSCLVVITSASGWPVDHSPEMRRIAVPAQAPRGDLVLAYHLSRLYPDPAKNGWVGVHDGTSSGGLADLLHPSMPPAQAADLATELGALDATVPNALDTARSLMLGWEQLVRTTFTQTEGNADDRALFLAAVLLDGDSPSNVLKAARRLLEQDETRNIADILTAPALATRLEHVQAKTDGQHVSFQHLPGYPLAVLRYVWHQLSDAQQHLVSWATKLTTPKGLAAARIDAVADLLVDLAAAEHDLTPLDAAQTWAHSSKAGQQAAAAMLATAAQHPVLGADVRSRLRTWASGSTESTATVAAVACHGTFATRYPRQALTCLRWLLDREDADQAVTHAADALRTMAAHLRLLPQVWEAVTSWVKAPQGDRGHRAGRRAFLTLLDPHATPTPAALLLANTLTDPATADDLVDGWCAILDDTTFHEPAERLLAQWAQAVADQSIDSTAVVTILDRVIDKHLMTGPMAAFLMGRAGHAHTSAAVVELRKHLMVNYRRATPPAHTTPLPPPGPPAPPATPTGTPPAATAAATAVNGMGRAHA
ncbi:hypothetical protein [Streptomyces anthocyanicus]|uniref:hypothetical protein n=1 Tax=Streptomyces anthocyanicus TaxID=68174 RepID=UPI00380F210D